MRQGLRRLLRRVSASALFDVSEAWRHTWRSDIGRLRHDHVETRLRLDRIERQLVQLSRAGDPPSRADRHRGAKVPLVLGRESTPSGSPDSNAGEQPGGAEHIGGEILEFDHCAVCGSTSWTDVCEYNKLFLLARGPDEEAKLARYAMCHDCGVVFARRRPGGRRFVYLLERFEAMLGRVGAGEKLSGRYWLNSARLDDDGRRALRQSLTAGVFVSDHQPAERGTSLPALYRDRIAAAAHIEILTSLLDLQRPRILELRPRFGAVGAGLVRRWGGEVYGLPLFEGQQLIAREVYGLKADRLLDLDRFTVPYEGSFDLIVSNHVFTHAIRPGEFLATVHDRLTPDGHIYLYNEPRDDEFLDHHESMFKVLNPFHFQAFDRDSFLRALRRYGFEPLFMSRDAVLARRTIPVSVSMSEAEKTQRLARYRAARDLSILGLPPALWSAFAEEWEDVVARVHAERLAELTPDGKLRLLRTRKSRAVDDALDHTI